MTSPTKFYLVTQILLWMWLCDQGLVTLAFLWEKLFEFYQKNNFFERYSWFKFNNFGLALGMVLKFYTSVIKGLKLEVRKLRLVPAFIEVTGEKLVVMGGALPLLFPHPDIYTPPIHHIFIYRAPPVAVSDMSNNGAPYSIN